LTGGGIAHSVSATSDLNNLKLGSKYTLVIFSFKRVCRNIIDWLGFRKHSFSVMLLANDEFAFPFLPAKLCWLATCSFFPAATPCLLPTLSFRQYRE
jgi:hypothetical protein